VKLRPDLRTQQALSGWIESTERTVGIICYIIFIIVEMLTFGDLYVRVGSSST
jgi:hypothetical protein